MNHDYAHCLDFTTDCPKSCFRAMLSRDYEKNKASLIGIPLTFASFEGTEECKRRRSPMRKMAIIPAEVLRDG